MSIFYLKKICLFALVKGKNDKDFLIKLKDFFRNNVECIDILGKLMEDNQIEYVEDAGFF